MKKEEPFFWVTNLSNRNVSLSDLNLTINSYTSVNLMDTKHYSYTLEQLQKSAENGSLFKKQKMLVVRKVPPVMIKMNMPLDTETYIPSRERSIYSIKEENYEELNVSDEDFAKENADIVSMDEKTIKRI